MRFWIGLVLGLVIGVVATVAYYELGDSGVEDDDVSLPASNIADSSAPGLGIHGRR
jgi:hypothetical protein